MTKEEIRQKAVDNAKRYEVWPPAADYQDGLIKGFEDCAKWMQETNEGKALLYAVEKTAERTKKEIINKACEWIKKNRDELSRIDTSGFIKLLKKAMEEKQ